MWRLEQALCAVVGVERVTLQPAAGAHGEWTALRMIKAYHHSRGEDADRGAGARLGARHQPGQRRAERLPGGGGHAPGPTGASASPTWRPSSRARVAALMLTNPNTLGLFERQILDIAEMVHATGAMLYYDGANLNAFMGICRPG